MIQGNGGIRWAMNFCQNSLLCLHSHRKGRCVLVMFAANWDHCTYNLVTIFRALLFTLEKLLENVRNQANGFVVIVDWSEFTYRQSTNLTPKLLKLMISFLQDCFPATFKGIHFVNQPWYVEAAFTFIRPFLKEKMKNKVISWFQLSFRTSFVRMKIELFELPSWVLSVLLANFM